MLELTIKRIQNRAELICHNEDAKYHAEAIQSDIAALIEHRKFQSWKDLLINQAKESGASKFKLVAAMNSNLMIFQWCDAEYNFVGMCTNTNTREKQVTVYGLEELEDVIGNAESWLVSIYDQNLYSTSFLNIMAVE